MLTPVQTAWTPCQALRRPRRPALCASLGAWQRLRRLWRPRDAARELLVAIQGDEEQLRELRRRELKNLRRASTGDDETQLRNAIKEVGLQILN